MIRVHLRRQRGPRAGRVLRAVGLAVAVLVAAGAVALLLEQRFSLLGGPRHQQAAVPGGGEQPLAPDASQASQAQPLPVAEETLSTEGPRTGFGSAAEQPEADSAAFVLAADSAAQWATAPDAATQELAPSVTATAETVAAFQAEVPAREPGPVAQDITRPAEASAVPAPASGEPQSEAAAVPLPAPDRVSSRRAEPSPLAGTASDPPPAQPAPGVRLPAQTAACVWTTLLPASPVCLRLGSLADTVVDGARVTAVTCRSSGEFTLEGVAEAQSPLGGLVVQLEALPSRVTLSWRSAGGRRTPTFSLQGEFGHGSSADLQPVSATDAQSLLLQIEQWARLSGIERLTVSRPPQVGLDAVHVHRRQKAYGVGTYAQIQAFLTRLGAMGPSVCVGELAVVPVARTAASGPQARLYTALDLVVRTP